MRVDRKIQSDYATLKMRDVNRKLKQEAVNYKGGKCENCGYHASMAALDFHHRDPTQKDFLISGSKVPWEAKKKELDKCTLLCANCHRQEHERLTDVRHTEMFKRVRQVISTRPKRVKITKRCPTCDREFQTYDTAKQVFCKRSCKRYVAWPPVKEIMDMLETMSPPEIAKILKVNSKSVRRHLQKNGISWDK